MTTRALPLLLAFLSLSLLSRLALAEEAAPATGEGAFGAAYALQLLSGLGVVLAGVFLLAWIMRRFGRLQGADSTGLKVLGGISVGQRERVVLIQVGERQLLLGVAPGSVQRLHELDEPLLKESARTAPGTGEPRFAERLGAILRQGRGG
jgi:flagellar protein FliO/FliZ